MGVRLALFLGVLFGLAAAPAPAQEAPPAPAPEAAKAAPAATEGRLPAAWTGTLAWRPIGPANMGGRITAIAVHEKDPSLWYVATASGGLLKTVNHGVTFEHQFDRERTVSIGDVAVAAANPDLVWVGTGEANPRNSVSWGDGVYKSTDGGKTWKRMGLERSFQIGAIAIHPADPDIVYVGALGRLWGEGGDRGLYRTADGGKTWERILHVDEKTGVIDVQLKPGEPDTLLVATWERQRDGFDTNDPAKKWGPGSGLWKSTDGGKSFRRITRGLPAAPLGRIGIDFCRSRPEVAYLVLESDRIGSEPENAPYLGINGVDADVGARLTQIVKAGPAEKAGLKQGDIIVGIDGETAYSYADLIRLCRRHVAGDTVKVEISRDRKGVELELTFGTRPAPEGEDAEDQPQRPAPRSMFAAGLGGQRANLQDQQGPEGHEYGGVYKSMDGGETWTRVNTVNPRPMYFSEIRVDPSDPEKVYVLGINLWRSKDGGKEFTPDAGRGVHPDHHALWIDPADGRHMVLGTDGGVYVTYDRTEGWDHLNHVAIGQFYHVAVGPRRNYRVYGGLQDNGSWGGPNRVRHARGPTNQDWFRVGGGDGFVCRVDSHDPDQVYFEMQNGGLGRMHLRTGERAGLTPRPPQGERYRFNWNTPFLLSHHNSRIYYVAGNKVFRSLDRGGAAKAISPEIPATDRGSATALAESPRDPDELWVGTDDGALWITRDGGHTWTDLYGAAEPEPAPPEPEPAPQPEPIAAEAGDPGSPHAGTANGSGNGDGKGNGSENGDGDGDGEGGGEGGNESEEGAEEPAGAPAATESPEAEASPIVARILALDTNGDGKVTRDEAPERARGMFERFDRNGDGAIERAEIEEAMRERRAAREARGGEAAPDEPERRRGAGGRAAPAAPKDPDAKPIRELVPERRWVNGIEPSRHKQGRAYLVFDGHRSDDDRPHVYVTEDWGASWKSLRGNLPDWAGTTRCLVEDLVNPDLLYLGTEFGAWASLDRGASWTSLHSNLPTVAVHAFAQHPTSGEIVAATHGRSLWILDVTPLRQMKAEALDAEVHLYRPITAILWRSEPGRGGSRTFEGENPPAGAALFYSLKKKADRIALKVTTADGTVVRTLEADGAPGLHRVEWNLRTELPVEQQNRWRRWGPRVRPGTYRVVLDVGGRTFAQDLIVEIDPEYTDPQWLAYEEAAELAEAEVQQARARRKFPEQFDDGRED